MSSKVPNIVASQTFLDQTVALAATTIYTPSAAGIFRVSINADWNGTGSISTSVKWTDEWFTRTNAQGGTWNLSFLVRSVASQPITLTVTQSGSPTWTADIVIEDLN